MVRIIAEKTGYPMDMLDLDLDLEADLGIDTVKQAEMFAAIRATYDIPREDNLKAARFSDAGARFSSSTTGDRIWCQPSRFLRPRQRW